MDWTTLRSRQGPGLVRGNRVGSRPNPPLLAVVLARAVFEHGLHDFGRDFAHVFEDHVSNMAVASWTFLFSDLLEPCLKGEPFGCRFCFERCCLSIGKLDQSHRNGQSPC